jgi:beta-mannosidase
MLQNSFILFDTNWIVGFSKVKENLPIEWFPATIPGAVQLDYAAAKQLGPWYYNDNFRQYRWMEDVYWFYKTRFKIPDLPHEKDLFFFSKGIDYSFEIFLNGSKLHSQEGMYTPVNILLSPHLIDENELVILVYPAPKISPGKDGRWQADQTCKPPSSYGWDWHPRLIPLGIWNDTQLEIRPKTHINQLTINQQITDDLSRSLIRVNIEGANLNHQTAQIKIYSPDGSEEYVQEISFMQSDSHSLEFSIDQPQLWWPVGMGKQNLYKLSVTLENTLSSTGELKSFTKCFGIRRTRLLMNHGAWDEPSEFPKSRSVPPITLEINNKKVFAKGTNWVQPEVFYGTLNRHRYEEMLALAVEANFNIIRAWGGGPVNKDSFFEICDEKGLMVWQEFPLACLAYEGTENYLAILKQEASSIINNIMHHPSLILWCGGNELFNNWSGMTDQSAALRLLNSLTWQLDPQTPFIPTAPVMGMGHGHYVMRDDETGEEVFQWMPRSHNTAYSEFGVSGPADVEILKQIIPDEELFPPQPGSSWEVHHAFNAWHEDTWLRYKMLLSYFGKILDLDDLVEKGQMVQGEGLKFIYEEARRQEPYCSMALNWCFNEPWPTAANCSIVSWPAVPRPAFYEVKQACRPALASAQATKFKWKPGETFTAGIFFLSHLMDHDLKELSFQAVSINVFIDNCTETIHLITWENVPIFEQRNVMGPAVNFPLPAWNCERFRLVLKVKNKPEWDSEYTFLLDIHSEKKIIRNKEQLN